MKKNKFDGRYGGTSAGKSEERAIMKAVKNSIRTGNWQAGLEAKKLEAEASKFLGVKDAILTTSGSCAGLLALSALEIPKGSEVIISAVTFPTIFNIILQCGLVPVVVDAKIGSYTFDVDEVEQAITTKTRAIIAIHPVGNPVDMQKLMKMVKSENNIRNNVLEKIYVIEDNCDGWGSAINNKRVGSFGDVSITSFHAAHIVSMGVGGGVFTNNPEISNKVRMYRDWGRQADTTQKTNGKKWKTLPDDYDSRFIYEKIGYNFQILELQASMGLVQIKKSDQIKKARKKNFDYLVKHLSQFADLVMPKTVKGADVCWFALPLTYHGNRATLTDYLEKHGIETRSMFSGNIIKHPAYRSSVYRKIPTPHADQILKRSFWITVHPRLTQSDREYIVKTFNDFFKKNPTS